MQYSPEQVEQLENECEQVLSDLQSLLFEGHRQSHFVEVPDARLHLQQGVGRRLGVLKQTVEKIFELFPPAQERPLQREELTDVQINLHAFVINLSGVFDNWAWAFMFKHGLHQQIGRRSVGLFKRETLRVLPEGLREHLASDVMTKWHGAYAKAYRDALAHRIPLYIPPATWTDADREKYEMLETQKVDCIRRGEWQRLDEVWTEQDAIGRACPMFLHEFGEDEERRPVLLHPQVLCDAATVVDCGRRFYAAWHQVAPSNA